MVGEGGSGRIVIPGWVKRANVLDRERARIYQRVYKRIA